MNLRPLKTKDKELLISALFALAKARFNESPSLNCSGKANQDILALRKALNENRIYERHES